MESIAAHAPWHSYSSMVRVASGRGGSHRHGPRYHMAAALFGHDA